MKAGERLRAGDPSARVAFTRPEKVLYPEAGITKADVIRYYREAAPRLLPFLKDRPLSVVRYPDGIAGERFFSKNAPPGTPDWVETSLQPSESKGKDVRYVVAGDTDTLLWLANLAALELHVPLSRGGSIYVPDCAVFDFDPEPPAHFPEAARAALLLREKLDDLGLAGYAKTSGKRGVHVIVPLDGVHTFEQTREFVHRVGRNLARENPWIVPEVARTREAGIVFFDYLLNAKGRTMIAPYSLRATPAATVSTPLAWEELARGVRPEAFTLRTVLEREDPWKGIFEQRQRLPALDPIPSGRTAARSRGNETLAKYRERRNFVRTPEPAGGASAGEGGSRFVVHEHRATRLHFDFRLERGGVLKSWAVPKGVPERPGVRHLAIETEDHPLEYIDFAGTIPEGEYGAGTVSIWDAGTYDARTWEPDKIEVMLNGQRLHGRYVFIRFKKAEEGSWLLFKASE